METIDEALLTDDSSNDRTMEIAVRLGIKAFRHNSNQNLVMREKLSEYHTGYRAFSRRVLETLPLLANSDDFIFDNQMLVQAIAMRFAIDEISCPTKYSPEASSINFRRSVVCGLGVLWTSVVYRLWRWGLHQPRLFDRSSTLRLLPDHY
jgi:hypothetical protein